LTVIAEQIAGLEDDLAQLYDDQFIETCADWVVPYIGDLLGVRLLHPVSAGTYNPRTYVANTLAYRRRKGTAAMLVQLVHEVTGWQVRLVEFFERLATTQHVNHPRLAPAATVDLRRGQSLRLVAEADDANVAALFYSREQPLERYNMADTLKAQHTAHLTTGCVCYSDMGRILCAITADTCGWHDPLCGLTDKAGLDEQYGLTRFQEQRNERYVSGREAMLVELGKHGLGARDLVANINFFSKVVVDASGSLQLDRNHCHKGDAVDLRFEMDCIVLLHAGPHPLQDGHRYDPPGVALQAYRSAPAAAGDPCRTRCPENLRGYINTERYVAA